MSKEKYSAPRGTADQLPDEIGLWQHVQSTFQKEVELWGYREIRTPMFEDTSLFERTSGDTSEVVTKQMYTFLDKGGRSITLRPEGTAPVMRAVLENRLLPPSGQLRLWYFIQNFRYERPQSGRMRQHHQLGLELIGGHGPGADAEVIEVVCRILGRLGLGENRVLLNSIGRTETRDRFRIALLSYLESWLKDQTDEERTKVEKNPLRLFDSKDPEINALMESAPLVTEHLEDSSRAHRDALISLLEEAGVNYLLDPRLVRGLDYYTDTVFEIQSTKLGSQSTLCGGGRYDGLIAEIGGTPTPSVGFGMGVERLLIALKESQAPLPAPCAPLVVVAQSPDQAGAARALARRLRESGHIVVLDSDMRQTKHQMKQADRLGAKTVFILNEAEMAAGQVTVKNLETVTQETLPLEEALARLNQS